MRLPLFWDPAKSVVACLLFLVVVGTHLGDDINSIAKCVCAPAHGKEVSYEEGKDDRVDPVQLLAASLWHLDDRRVLCRFK